MKLTSPVAWGSVQLALLAAASACGRTEAVASGPITLDRAPSAVPFTHSVVLRGPRRELCCVELTAQSALRLSGLRWWSGQR